MKDAPRLNLRESNILLTLGALALPIGALLLTIRTLLLAVGNCI